MSVRSLDVDAMEASTRSRTSPIALMGLVPYVCCRVSGELAYVIASWLVGQCVHLMSKACGVLCTDHPFRSIQTLANHRIHA